MRNHKVEILKKKRRVSLLLTAFVFLLLMVVLPLATYYYFSYKTADLIFDSPKDVPRSETALVLGTSKYLKGGKVNQFFRHRMDAAQLLYIHGKVRKIILSGDHQTDYYNEPLAMKSSLKAQGIPEEIMVMDPSGLRTFDSVIRAYKIYGVKEVTIVSQRFHLERALFIAKKHGVKAYGFVADDTNDNFTNLRQNIRECYARVLTLVDLYAFETQPTDMSPAQAQANG